MKTPDFRNTSPIVLTLALLSAVAVLGGCIYRPNIQQGNLLSAEEVDKVTVGMTRSQVRYLLGTPMVSDPFAPQRWDYVYRLTHGRPRRTDSAHFIVRFEGDTVVAVEKVDAPEPRIEGDTLPATPPVKGKTPEDLREPPPPPVISQPQPDAARRADPP
jgi:outer membrane protein assembly factor BamE